MRQGIAARLSLRAKFKSSTQVEVCIMRESDNATLIFVLPIKFDDTVSASSELVDGVVTPSAEESVKEDK